MLIKLNNWVFVQIVACGVLFACVFHLASSLQVVFCSVVMETTAIPGYVMEPKSWRCMTLKCQSFGGGGVTCAVKHRPPRFTHQSLLT